MALRSLAAHLRPLVGTGARLVHSAPTVFDKMVQFYVIDKSGARHTVRGLEGSSLASTLRETGASTCRCAALLSLCHAAAAAGCRRRTRLSIG